MAMGVYTLKTEVSLKNGRICKIILACISYKVICLQRFVYIFRQALTEISVLSDVLQILQNHRNYVVMDPVMAQPTASVTPGYQYIVTKKVSLVKLILDYSLKLFLSPKHFTNLGSGCGSWYSPQGNRVPFKGFFTWGEGVPQSSL